MIGMGDLYRQDVLALAAEVRMLRAQAAQLDAALQAEAYDARKLRARVSTLECALRDAIAQAEREAERAVMRSPAQRGMGALLTAHVGFLVALLGASVAFLLWEVARHGVLP